WVERLQGFRFAGERLQRLCLTRVSGKLEQIAEPPNGRVLVNLGELGQLARVGFAAQVLRNLRHAVDACRAMEVARAVQKSKLDARHLCEAGLAFHLREPFLPVGLLEGVGSLIDELETMAPDLEASQLLRNDDLEYHGRLMRRAVERGCAKQ